MYQNIKDNEWIGLICCLKLCNELFKIEEYCMLSDSSLPVACLFLHDSGPFALYPFFCTSVLCMDVCVRAEVLIVIK
jgi:hypothetical protein